MNAKPKRSPQEIKAAWDALFAMITPEEQLEIDGLVLGQAFLSKVHEIMEARGMSRKELAEQMNTSASFLTQLFRGDRPLSDRNKALMAKILGIRWEIKAVPLAKPYAEHLAEGKAKKMSVAAEPVVRYGKKAGKGARK